MPPRKPPEIGSVSPSGQKTCPGTGPLDAEILVIGESPASNEIKDQEPFTGQAGRILNLCLTPAGINRPDIRIVNCIPAIAPGGTDFSQHSLQDIEWGKRILEQEMRALPNLKVVMPLGNNPMAWTMGLHQITKWRGSLIPPDSSLTGDRYNEYWTLLHRELLVESPDVAFLPSFHPAAVSRQFPWHYWLINDFRRAREYVSGDWKEPKKREWFVNRPDEINRFVDHTLITHEHLVAIDTEMDPLIVALVSEEEVHVFTFHDAYRPALERLMSSPWVLKVAHNMAHDWRQFHKVFGIPVSRPWFDTIAGAHILEPSGMDPGGDRLKGAGEQQVGKALSPHIATRYTPWPYHKWLVDLDNLHYCGIDAVVAYDAYWEEIEQLTNMPQGLDLVNHDHKLFEVTMAMQNRGLRVDEPARQKEMEVLEERVTTLGNTLEAMSEQCIREAYNKGKLKKPHLFRETVRCKCCRGAKNKMQRCWSCSGFKKAPSKKDLLEYLREPRLGATKADLENELLGPCSACNTKGTWKEWLPIKFSSDDQMKDLFYRALGIPARKYKGKETINIHQLKPLSESGGLYCLDEMPKDSHRRPAARILAVYIERNLLDTQLSTIKRIAPDELSRIHPTYDLWYTPTQRVASRESLLDPGTNAQNLPKESRRFIIPSDGYAFNYVDYAQIESRCVAVLCKDQKLIDIFQDPTKDSHTEVRLLVEKHAGIKITRDQSKRTMHAISYGIEEEHLAGMLNISIHEAKMIIAGILSTFTGLRRYKDDVVRELRSTRSNTSPTGWRRRWLNYVMITKGRGKGTVRPKVIKEALATKPQNMAARVLGLGLINMYDDYGSWLHPVAHVHDAGLFEEPLNRMKEADKAIVQGMSLTLWDMPFPAAPSHGPNWYIASMEEGVDNPEKQEAGFKNWTRESILNA